mmetsp:Transcript_14402/g.27897  ORF Transcript_14402/g.27897 Transcript_14402/m.27897 type:complete len:267 (+) Transcript_14402:47-847(+)
MPKPQHGGKDALQAGSPTTADCWLPASNWLKLPASCGSYSSGGENEVVALPMPPVGVGMPVVEADVVALKPLLEEVRQLRKLRVEVDQLWIHIRQLAERADAHATLTLPGMENLASHRDERSSIQHLIREEVSQALSQDDNSIRDKLKTRHAELQQQLCETEQWAKCKQIENLNSEDGSRKLLPGVESDMCRLSADRQLPPSEDDLDFGAPVGKTLNSQDWLALHASVKTEVQDCRAEVVRLCRRVGCWSEATTSWARMLPEGDPA